MIEPLLAPDMFVGLTGVTHLCTGGEAPWLKAQEQVYADFARLKSAGYAGRSEIYARGETCRGKVGQLWGVAAKRIAFMPSAAEGMNWLARGLDWREGDNVITTELEFPSVAYAWKDLRQRGVEVRMVAHKNWIVEEQDLLAAADERTRVMAVSQVSFYTGQNLDVEQLANGTKQRGILLAVDATHAAGVVQVPAGVADLCVSSSYKWMLATHGVAPCYMSERAEAQVQETSYGWHNLAVWPQQGAERHAEVEVQAMPEKMEPGNPAMAVVFFLDQALEAVLEIGIERVEEHARALGTLLRSGLEERGYTVITPADPKRRAGNTCFLTPDAEGLRAGLQQRQVLAWGEYGRLRVSGHLYNGSKDVERFFAVLEEIG